MRRRRAALFVVALWAVVVAGGLAARPAWPIDETRYLAVAWEMWEGGDLLVPHLNGTPYSDKPPLLFWLVAAGWRLFGVSEWWARLVPSLFALGSLFATARLARRLWPDREDVAHAAPLFLLATFFWSFFSTVFLFDMLLVFFALVAVSGAVAAAEGDNRGWIAVTLGIALGILAKGPAILLPVLPVILMAPAWFPGGARPARWYLRATASIIAGLALSLAWALPAALSGGRAYGEAILWSQTAGRVTRAFAHPRPIWWYAPFLPLLAFPWVLWPAVWRRADGRAPARDKGLRLCAVWAGAGFVAFSLVSGKQVYYLLPLLPPLALLGARLLPARETAPRRRELAFIAAAFVLLAAVLAGARSLAHLGLPSWISSLPPAAGLAVAICAAALLFPAPRTRAAAVERVAAASVVAVLATLWAVGRAAAPNYDVSRIARYLTELESEGRPLAHAGRYHGEYQFAGRLTRPLEVLEPDEVDRWLSRHPDGYVVVYSNRLIPEPEDELRHDFRGGVVAVRHVPGRGSSRLKSPGAGSETP